MTPPLATGDAGRVLIFVPKLTLEGGVANYYRMIKDFLPDNYCFFEKSQAKTLPGKLLATIYDLLRYVLLLTFKDFQLVCFNPSMQPMAVKREAVYIFITKKVFRKKLVIFWHGWQESYASEIEKHHLAWFRKRYFAAEKMLVLISGVCDKLRSWGYQGEIKQVITCFEESFAGLTVQPAPQAPFKILFLARVELGKGVITALQALKILRSKCSVPVKMTVAGNGSALAEAEKFARENGLEDVEFPGYIRGKAKIDCLLANDIFLQPSLSEGLPCAMLEAMACGLAVVTSKVGGIPDFFAEGVMGFMVDSQDPAVYAEKLADLINDPVRLKQCGEYNCMYARKKFCASAAAKLECKEITAVMNAGLEKQ